MESSSLWLPKVGSLQPLTRWMGLSTGCETKCVAFLVFFVFPCGIVSGKKTASLVLSSESFMWYCWFLIYSGNRMRNLFWLSSNGFQPRSLQVSSFLFLGEEIWIEKVCITLLQELVSLRQITRGYGAARYCRGRRGLFVGRPFNEILNTTKRCFSEVAESLDGCHEM